MPAGIVGRRNVKRRTSQKNGPNRPMPATPVGIGSVTKSGTTMTIVFNQPVTCNGIPAYTTDLPDVHTTAASMTNATTLSLTFSAAIATATELNIPFEEPAIRGVSGGFVSPGTFPA